MPSVADDCWRLSADCSHWAEESRDNSARLAFRQMALAWRQDLFIGVWALQEVARTHNIEFIVSPKARRSQQLSMVRCCASGCAACRIRFRRVIALFLLRRRPIAWQHGCQHLADEAERIDLVVMLGDGERQQLGEKGAVPGAFVGT
jgi:hypothetical protein